MAIRRFSVLTLVLIFALSLTVSANPVTSVYSSLSGCKSVTEGAWSISACRGVGGYHLLLEYGDVSESITVVSPNGRKYPLNFSDVINSSFNSVGEKVEWRITKQNRKLVPLALIVRYNASDNPKDSGKVTSYLTVAKITPKMICLTNKTAPGSTANADARAAADSSADKPCLKAAQTNHSSSSTGQLFTAAGSINAVASSSPAGMPYIGRWSNGRGERLAVTKRTLKFNSDKSVTFRDVTKVTDGNHFSLQITSRGKLNYFTKFIALSLENDEMKMTLYDSYEDMFDGKNSQGESTWYRDK
jgi:hypothetical protein